MNHTPIEVRQPDGTTFKSVSKGEIKINPKLPKQARVAHGFKDLKTNLISMGQLCDQGCTAMFDKEKCIIKHNNNQVIKGIRNHNNGLWYIPLTGTKEVHTFEGEREKADRDKRICNNIHRINKLQDVLEYVYASLFSPTKSTLLKAIKIIT